MARVRHTRHGDQAKHVPAQPATPSAVRAYDLAREIAARLNESDHAFEVDVFDEDDESHVALTDDATRIIEDMILSALRTGGIAR